MTTFKVTREVPMELLESVCVTALEGGSNYWYFLSDDACRMIRRVVPKSEDPCLSTAILKAVVEHNVAVPINDAEDEEEIIGYFDKKTISARLNELFNDHAHRYALEAELNDEGDGNSSDVVFQYLVLGDCIYG